MASLTDSLAIAPNLLGGFVLVDSLGESVEVLNFDTKEEAALEKAIRFIFKGARGLSGDGTYADLRDALDMEIRSKLIPKMQGQDYCDGWFRDFDSTYAYYCAKQKNYAVEYTKEKDGKITLGTPFEVVIKTVYEKVSAFTLGSFAEFAKEPDGYVSKEGKIFEAGNYPDKGVEVTEADLDRMIEKFKPVFNDLEHMDTILDEKLGRLEKVWRKGKELFGKVTVPKWLSDSVGADPIKTSIALSKKKEIVGNALVLNPRITDAAIMSAFTANKPETKGTSKMNLRTLAGIFGLASATSLDDELPEEAGKVFTDALKSGGKLTREQELEAELATFRENDAKRRANVVDLAAKEFAKKLIEAEVILPAAHDEAVAQFKLAINADGQDGAANFSETGTLIEGTHTAALRKMFEGKGKVGPNASTATIPAEGLQIFSGSNGAGNDVDAILNATSIGREAAAKAAKAS